MVLSSQSGEDVFDVVRICLVVQHSEQMPYFHIHLPGSPRIDSNDRSLYHAPALELVGLYLAVLASAKPGYG